FPGATSSKAEPKQAPKAASKSTPKPPPKASSKTTPQDIPKKISKIPSSPSSKKKIEQKGDQTIVQINSQRQELFKKVKEKINRVQSVPIGSINNHVSSSSSQMLIEKLQSEKASFSAMALEKASEADYYNGLISRLKSWLQMP